MPCFPSAPGASGGKSLFTDTAGAWGTVEAYGDVALAPEPLFTLREG